MKAAKWGVLLAVLVGLASFVVSRMAPPPILVENALLRPMHDGLGLTLGLRNDGGADRLISAHSVEAGQLMPMGGAFPLALPEGSRPSFSMDGAHLMLSDLTGALDTGRLVPVTLVFEEAGEITTRARVELEAETDHGAMEMGKGEPLDADGASMRVVQAEEGWEVTLTAPGLTLSSESADGPHEPGIGHAHLYLNGLKLQRLFQSEVTIGALPPGAHIIAITLNTNDHRAYTSNGVQIRLEQAVEVR